MPSTAVKAAANQPNLYAQKDLVRVYNDLQKRSEHQLWLRRSALLGDVESAITLANLLPDESRAWLTHAADLGSTQARVELSYAQIDTPPNYTIASEAIANLTVPQRNQLAILAMSWDQQATAQHWRNIAPETTRWQNRIEVDDWFRAATNQCDRHLVLYTENPSSIPKLYDWLYQIKKQFTPSAGRLCVSKALPHQALSCSPVEGRAHCQHQSFEVENSTAVYVTERGRANTRNGVVFINDSTSWHVFIHELAHAWGLADEYRMHISVREPFCEGQFSFTAKNLVVSDSSLLTDSEYQNFLSTLPWREELTVEAASRVRIMGIDYWRLGSSSGDGIGLYPAATCEGTGVQAWKPLRAMTFMEQAEIGKIPTLYLEWMLEPNL
ncbi:hypothetical protein [Aliidiomarina sp. B3213]|nr:hypothetical protein [Aliidiomarina sp. B3213]RTE87464.1 hypothetical protein DQX04_03520 [Aliidiomarina sp. B3213]TCZ92751.1 hypothetical protein EYQ95_01785 [Lysobacter sp. N42]